MRHYLRYVTLIGVGILVGMLWSPAWGVLSSLAQSGCQSFPQTGHKICGKFLAYWQQHGGLAQQGYPISEEFTETSDLNGNPYTVQYFERAVFELHPENKPPYDVLLSQLGTFRAREKYPNGFPPSGTGKRLKVGLVTDVGTVNDGSFNELAYNGLKRAQQELGVEISFIETVSYADYEENLEYFASREYDLIVAVGFLMGDAVQANAAKHPDIKYAIVDFAYDPAIRNVRGLVFAEDQAGYLAGALAASMSKSNVIGAVGGIEGVPAVKRFVLGYENGAKSVKPGIQVKKIYIDSFVDRARGAEAAKDFMGQGADVIFGAGGQTGSGAIQAAAQAGTWAIGVDQDEFVTTFQNGAVPGSDKILSSAMKRVDNAVFSTIKDAQVGTLQGDIQLYDAASQGVGLAPFHRAETIIPASVKTRLTQILSGLADGTIRTGVTVP